MSRLHAAIACAIAMGSCAHSTGMVQGIGPFALRQCSETFYVYEADTDPDDRENIREGFDYWNSVVGPLWYDGGPVADGMEPNQAYAIVRFVPVIKTEEGDEPCGYTTYSWYPNGCVGRVLIEMSRYCESKMTVGAWDTVMRHEIGHAMGFTHSRDRAGLMYESPPWFGDVRELSDAELDDLGEVY